MDSVTSRAAAEPFAAKLGRILARASETILLVDAATLRLAHANDGARRHLGLGDGEPQLSILDVLPEQDADAFARLVAPLRDGSRDQVSVRTAFGRAGGDVYTADLRLGIAAEEDPPLLLAIATDAGDACDVQLRRAGRAMTALTRATEALIHATDWLHLLDEVCRIVVEVGGYRLAWVGWVRHDDEKSVEPVAKCGYETDYVQHVRITWADSERGRGPSGTAIRTRRPQIARNTATESTYAPWRDSAARHGFASSVSLPLIVQDVVVGVLNIYSAEPHAFDDDEMRLLEDLARNLSYGIGTLRAEQQRRRAEAELKESEERYRSLVELSPDAILAHRKGRIVFANAAAHRIFRTPDQHTLVGRHVFELLPPGERVAAAQRLEMATPPGQLSEETMVRLDGENFAAEMTAAEIVYHGVPTSLMVLRDVTERRLVQDQLVQTAKLATLGEMAAGMAHELSQPLNVIRMAAEGALMLIDRGRANSEYKQKQFHLISDQTRRMAEIIDHIRIFSRKDTGEVEAFDAAQAVRLAIELFERQLAGDAIGLSTSYPANCCPVVGRPVQLEQVVMNLLANSADSVRDKRQRLGQDFHGKLEVVTTCSEELGLVWISVSDNGTGIPPHALERIFEPFFTTKEIGRGTGLGLSVSFGIVASMSGRIDACNNKEGASFVVTLPMSKAVVDVRPPPMPVASRPLPSGGTVTGEHHLLVVDDEVEAAAAMACYLREHGYRVTTAANGSEAWQAFQSDPAEVVITDLRMPNGDGRELLGRLRGHDPLLPVIVVTGHMGTTERLNDEDVDDELAVVLTKPVSLQTLVETVEQFLQS